ncbi:MAG: sulfatase [Bacteroidales bacterium]|nr:sulfatase [Bacteroidales bacterium]
MKKKFYRIRLILTGAGILILTGISSCALKETAETDKPNFIIIFTDDQGYGDLGCYGSPNIATPHIDKFAGEGMRFTSFYAAPYCGPSRAQLMTGSYPARTGHAQNTSPSSTNGLDPEEITIAEILKENGYATMCIGKWHLGHAPDYLPTNQGFDHFFGTPYSNDMWRYHPRMRPQENEDSLMQAIRKRAAYTGYHGEESYYPADGGFPNDLPLMVDERIIERNPDQRQLTTRYTESAIEFIQAKKDEPFFLFLAYNMPHVPLFVSGKFDGASPRGLYGDVMMEIDWSVGEILATLTALGLDDKTMVVFTSDNGPWLQYGIDGGSAGPLRAGKGTLYEGGVRVPALVRWPGKIPAGKISSAITGNHDLLPTLAELAGASIPSDRTIDGRSLWPLLSGENTKTPHDFFHYMGGSPKGKVNYHGIRDERWKLMVNVNREGKVIANELYDLGADVGEKFNRIEDHPDIADKLKIEAQLFYNEISENIRNTK